MVRQLIFLHILRRKSVASEQLLTRVCEGLVRLMCDPGGLVRISVLSLLY